MHGYTINELARQSRLSSATIRRILRYWLTRTPPTQRDFSHIHAIICDGTYLHHKTGIYAVMDACTHRIIAGGYNISEGSQHLPAFFTSIAAQRLCPVSATVDGNPQQSKYLAATWPSLTFQRCLVHVTRQGISWCRANPIRTEARHLRRLFVQLSKVRTPQQRDCFLANYSRWEQRFGARFTKAKQRAYVSNDLIAARNMLRRAIPNLFHFLDDPKIPFSTNSIEGYFGRMKEHFRRHRGLSKKYRHAFFQWYFFLVQK